MSTPTKSRSMSSLGDRQITPVEIKLCEASTHRSVQFFFSTHMEQFYVFESYYYYLYFE